MSSAGGGVGFIVFGVAKRYAASPTAARGAAVSGVAVRYAACPSARKRAPLQGAWGEGRVLGVAWGVAMG